jgi:hypothetical protein
VKVWQGSGGSAKASDPVRGQNAISFNCGWQVSFIFYNFNFIVDLELKWLRNKGSKFERNKHWKLGGLRYRYPRYLMAKRCQWRVRNQLRVCSSSSLNSFHPAPHFLKCLRYRYPRYLMAKRCQRNQLRVCFSYSLNSFHPAPHFFKMSTIPLPTLFYGKTVPVAFAEPAVRMFFIPP